MTPCARYPDDDVVMRYVAGDLADSDSATFEDHLFACDACLARVERYQAAQQVLAARELPAMPTVVPTLAVRPGLSRSRWRIVTAVAATLVLGLGGAAVWRTSTAPGPSAPIEAAQAQTPVAPKVTDTPAVDGPAATSLRVAVLAMVTPPPYLPMVTRGAADMPTGFVAGMDAYVRGDWPAAARALAGVESPEARFYRGIAELMRGSADAATAAFEGARASGQQPYARESLFYLGKVALQRGDLAGARTWLVAARDADAGPSGEARRLLAALDDLEADR